MLKVNRFVYTCTITYIGLITQVYNYLNIYQSVLYYHCMRKNYLFYILFLAFGLVPMGASAAPVVLGVPFTSQAPEDSWVEPWLNACEETSMVMVESYYRGNWSLTVKKSKKEIQYVIDQKKDVYGTSKDESPEKIVKMIQTVYKRQAEVEKDITVEKIKKQIDGGYPVLMAFDTRLVTNANFISPKPTYHVAVVVGYDDERGEFVVNDPGTSDGNQFRYKYDELLNANKSYTVRDTGEVRGNEAVFTSSIRLDAPGFFAKFFEVVRSWFQ